MINQLRQGGNKSACRAFLWHHGVRLSAPQGCLALCSTAQAAGRAGAAEKACHKLE